MHIRTDTDGRIVARRTSPPPSGAPGTWHEVADDALTPPAHDPWQQASAYYDGTEVTFDIEDRPQDDPARQAKRIADLEDATDKIALDLLTGGS